MPYKIERAEETWRRKPSWKELDEAWSRILGHVPVSTGRFDWSPAIDVAESDGGVVIKAELPGLEAEDIDIDVTSDMLILKGEKKNGEAQEGGRVYHRERIHGRFQRVFKLPPGVENDRVAASFKNGILTVTIPRSGAHKSNRVDIRTA